MDVDEGCVGVEQYGDRTLRYYLIAPGDTLSEICERLGVSMQRVIDLNALGNADMIYAGARLWLPERW
jgi:LysM repeat protein